MSLGQNADKLFYGNESAYLDIYWFDSLVNVTSTDFYGKTIRFIIKPKSSNRVQEEFIRYNDTSFIYLQYDSSGKNITKGLLSLNKNRVRYDTILVPDLTKDPDLSKGIMKEEYLSYCFFDKTGYWREHKGHDTASQGLYVKGKRQGIWKNGRDILQQTFGFDRYIFVVDDLTNYTDTGTTMHFKQDLSDPVLQKLLAQKWDMNERNSSRTNRHYTRSKEQFKHPDLRNPFRYTGDGIVKVGNKDFKIVYISETELYLQLCKE